MSRGRSSQIYQTRGEVLLEDRGICSTFVNDKALGQMQKKGMRMYLFTL